MTINQMFVGAINGKCQTTYIMQAINKDTGEVLEIEYATKWIAEEVAAEYRQAGHQASVI